MCNVLIDYATRRSLYYFYPCMRVYLEYTARLDVSRNSLFFLTFLIVEGLEELTKPDLPGFGVGHFARILGAPNITTNI